MNTANGKRTEISMISKEWRELSQTKETGRESGMLARPSNKSKCFWWLIDSARGSLLGKGCICDMIIMSTLSTCFQFGNFLLLIYTSFVIKVILSILLGRVTI